MTLKCYIVNFYFQVIELATRLKDVVDLESLQTGDEQEENKNDNDTTRRELQPDEV